MVRTADAGDLWMRLSVADAAAAAAADCEEKSEVIRYDDMIDGLIYAELGWVTETERQKGDDGQLTA